MIVLEGMDNSGKSTLAKKLGFQTIHPGPAPKSFDEETNFMDNQLGLASHHLVMDRITCISQQVYQDKLFDKRYIEYLKRMQEVNNFAIIYCRPPDSVILNFKTHQPKKYDTKDSLKKIEDNAIKYLGSYDKLMATINHIVYDYTRHLDEISIPLIRSTQNG